MDAVKKLYEVSAELLSLLEKGATSEERDEFIHQIEAYLEDREKLIKATQPPYTTEQKTIGMQLIEVNKKIDQKLTIFKNEIQSDLRKLQNNKVSQEKYHDPYQTDTISGLFYDKRK
ncbi:flagellar protein FliT [Metabacillus litoralis]|uniref:flagellar protein FliT n=1 Tax=Metabacillus litoralis TaxID=152268 RepID=UPI002040D3BD|nr:flagellar protein FliT [Metabacillus litoralis]MCM3162329.1 flagellar protein FliT [Metabacillus litoralis]